jgi:hypothetical protein
MIVAGFLWLWREYGDKPFHITRARWAFILLGGLTVFVAFIYDFPNTARGGNPNAFRWDVFFVGEAIALLAFATTRRRKIGSSQLA